ncbi:MAG: hypothetical protein F4213_13110 [Boseongicola sp. SB0677_bin_26]|nr:hypothetical protein [Boseongicola sp. SB0665_bin_10]MYG26939.1 hypothetical protein [Boseongicola sp. SB0677_bin_26]
MQLNGLKMLDRNGFPCLYAADGGHPDRGVPARAAYVTAEALADVSLVLSSKGQDGERVGPCSVDVELGDVIVAFDEPDAERPQLTFRTLSINGGDGAAAYLEAPDDEQGLQGLLSLTGPETLLLRERLAQSESRSETHDRCLQRLDEMFHTVREDREDRFSGEMVATAYYASMTDSILGDAPIPVELDEFVRMCRANVLRARIGALDPDHADALQSSAPLMDILNRHGVSPVTMGSGGKIRGQVNIEDDLLRAVAANEMMTRDVFGRLTTTSVPDLSASIVALDELQKLRSSAEMNALSGDWVDLASTAVKDAIGESMPGYEFKMEMYCADGRDLMLIEDSVGARTGHAYVYSWPRATRLATAEMNGQSVLQLSSEECPNAEEIARLEAVIEHLPRVIQARPADLDDDTPLIH